jgi:hypothetical protein
VDLSIMGYRCPGAMQQMIDRQAARTPAAEET